MNFCKPSLRVSIMVVFHVGLCLVLASASVINVDKDLTNLTSTTPETKSEVEALSSSISETLTSPESSIKNVNANNTSSSGGTGGGNGITKEPSSSPTSSASFQLFEDISPQNITATSFSGEGTEYDGPIRKCTQRDSAGLNKCLQQVLKDLKPRLAQGVAEINLPPMEPLKLSNVAFEQGSGPVKIVSSFTNVEVTGLSNFSQSDFWVDVPKRTLDFDLIFPQLSLVGNYEISGNLFFIPIGGTGNFYLTLGGTRAKGESKLGVFRNSTLAQVVVKQTGVSLEIDNIKVHLTNLFNGDPLLGTVINNFLNENSQEVFEEVKPEIGAQVGELLSLLANRALSALSTSQFDDVPFSPSPTDEIEL